MRAALAGAPVTLRAPDAVRPWQHVLNPLEGYLTVAERLLSGDADAAGPWNFGPDEADARPVGWLVERIADRWPGPLDVRVEPGAEGEAPTLRLDATRARDRLGWRPRWDLDAGLDATVSWYAAHRDGADLRAETLGQIAAFQRGGS
jgi:CDP-glucose 4,6-dehydratase